MSLSVLHQPAARSLVKNPVVFELSTNNEMATTGVATVQTLSPQSIPSDGDTFQIAWLNGSVDLTFTFRSIPDNSGLELNIGSPANLADFVENVFLPDLLANYYLNRDFEISYAGGSVIDLEARHLGAAYEFTFTAGPLVMLHAITTPGVDPVLRENFRIISEFRGRYNGDVSWQNAELELIPINSKVVFDYAPLLKAFDKLVLPNLLSTSAIDVSEQVIEYEARFAEAYGLTMPVQRVLSQPLMRGLWGGYNTRDRLAVVWQDDVFPKFLTHRQKVYLRETQPYFLSFWNDDQVRVGQKLIANLIYTDGTAAVKTIETVVLSAYELIYYPVGFNRLQLAADPNKTVASAYCYLEGLNDEDGVDIVINRKPVPAETFLAYRNAYGMLEVQCFTGQVLKTLEVEHEVVDLLKRWDTPYEEPRQISFNKELIYGLEINSGNFSPNQAELLADCLSSDRHYLIVNNRYVPVVLKAEAYEIGETRRGSFNQFSLTLIFRNEDNYSDVGDRIG